MSAAAPVGGMTWAGARRVLAVRLDSAGDVLMTEPAIRALRAAVPGRRVTLLTSPAGALAAPLLADVDETVVYRVPWMKHEPAPALAEDLAFLDYLRARRFDAAVIFTVFSQSPLPAALMATWAGIPLRIAHCRENPYHLLTDWIPESDGASDGAAMRHEVQRQIDLARHAGAILPSGEDRIRLAIPDPARDRVRALLATEGPATAPLAVVHAGASAPSRRYPPERFAQVVRALVAVHGWRVALTGGPDEGDLVRGVRETAGVPVVDLAGRLSFAELAAAVEAAEVVVTNNSAPAHLAAGTGTPVVDLYALTNPQHTPWRVPHRLLFAPVSCAHCFRSVCPAGHHGCLRGVEAHEVVQAAVGLVAGRAQAD